MKGLSVKEYDQLLKLIDKFHRFEKIIPDAEFEKIQNQFPNIPQSGFNIKYIDVQWNNVSGTFNYIAFRRGRFGVCFSIQHKAEFTTLFEMCKAYLTGNLDASSCQLDIKTNDSNV